MMTVAFIPVRGGSKSIPLKNIKEVAGKPLIYWTAKAANDARCIDRVYVATDSDVIKDVVEGFALPKVHVITRSEESSTDTASTEAAMLEFAPRYNFDNIILIQATSPLLTAEDLDGGYSLYEEKSTDSVLSVVRQKRFNWEPNKNGYAKALNYNPFHRPRRQEFDGYYVENGAFYITSKSMLIESRCRISGNIRVYEMKEDTYFEIDEPTDWIIIEQLLKKRIKIDREIAWENIKMFLTDCDGVLTDGGMYYSENGDEQKKFNTKDGMGFKLLKEKGIITGIITGEKMSLNSRRAKKMHIDELHQDVQDKLSVISQLCDKYKISMEEVLYIGDDINDIEAIKRVGVGCCVSDAMEDVKKVAVYVAKHRGGDAAVREIIDFILTK